MTPPDPHVPEPTVPPPIGVGGGPPPTLPAPEAASTEVNPSPATAAPLWAPRPTGLQGYDILEEIAHGGMGIVFKARQVGLDRLVALKVMIAGEHATPEALQRFQREARAAAGLQHAHVVQVYDVGCDGARHFFTMQFVEGRSLAEAIRRQEITPRRALEVARKVALALDYAHAQGVIHRDVKPANVLLDAQGEPLLADFGLAREQAAEGVTASGSFLGTPGYAAPEQTAGETDRVDARSDVYALGATLYHALTGRPPFSGDNVFAILRDVLEADPVPPRQVNPGIQRDIETICLKAMEKLPERRYPTAREMADDIGRYLDGEPIHARRASWMERQWRRAVRNRRVLVPTAIAAALAASFLTWLGLASWRTSRRVAGELVAAARWERQAESASERGERLALLSKARDALLGSLRLDEGNRAAREALHRVARRLDALQAEMEAERFAAARSASAAEEALGKAGLVSKVFTRWRRLSADVGALEANAYDDRLSADQRVARARVAWAPIERFLAETPDDATSRAAAGALAAWAERYLGDHDRALAHMQEAARAAPDLPYGRLMEALDIFAQLVEASPLPILRTGPTGIEIGESRSLAGMETVSTRLTQILGEARSARVWGEESTDDFKACMDGILALQRCDWAVADEVFTRALAAPDLATFASGLLLARAEVRFMAKRFQEALEDLALLEKARPGWANVPFRQAEAIYAIALAASVRGDDVRPRIREAVERFDAAIALSPRRAEYFELRGLAWQLLGQLDGDRGTDPIPALEKAAADLEETVRLDGACDFGHLNLGHVRTQIARVQASKGVDPSATLDRGLEALGKALALDPDRVEVWINRGSAICAKVTWVETRGGDPRELLTQAIREYDEALKRSPGMAQAWNNRGWAWLGIGRAQAMRGIDPTVSFERAMSDIDRALVLAPTFVEAWVNRGDLRTNLGKWLLHSGGDPSDVLVRAIDDFERASSLNPSFGSAYDQQGFAGRLLGEWEGSHGKDPRPRYEAAVKALDEALRRNPRYVFAYNNRGLVWQARAEWEAAAGLDPRDSLARAIADEGKLLESIPGSFVALCNRGLCWARMARAERKVGMEASESIEKARADFQAALSANPGAWQIYVGLGEVFELSGNDEKALEAYERASAIVGDAFPEVTEAIRRLKEKK